MKRRKKTLKTKRSRVLHHIRRLCRDNAEQELERKAEEVERLHDGAQMFKAVNLVKRRKHRQPLVQDDTGHFIGNDLDTAAAVRSHFHQQFNCDSADGFEPFQRQPRELNHSITIQEVARGFRRLNNGRACGS